MRRLVVFQQLSPDGCFVERNGDMSWAKKDNDEEFNAFTSENAKGGGVLLFGSHL
jgi:dihydrofolate reductase